MKKALCLFLCSFFIAITQAAALENYRYYLDAQTFKGPTGNIETPSSEITPAREWTFGLHRFVIGINYGLFRNAEIGTNFDLKAMSSLNTIESKQRELYLHAKYRILSEDDHPFSISVGQHRHEFYITSSKYFEPLWNSNFQAGLSWQDDTLRPYFAWTQSHTYEQMVFEYQSRYDRYNFGWRFLLSPEVKIDFFVIDCSNIKNIFLDNFLFGITVVG
jgi:hypothetical protein